MNTVNVKKLAVEIFSLYSRILLHRENAVREMFTVLQSPCISRSIRYGPLTLLPGSPWRRFTTPQCMDHLPSHPAIEEARKQVHAVAILKVLN